MKTIPEPCQISNQWLENRNSSKILNPSNSTDLETRQNLVSSADNYVRIMTSNSLSNCLRAAETILHTSCAELRKNSDNSTATAIPSNSMGLSFKPPRTGLAAGKRHITFSNWNALRTELSRIHSSSLSLRGGLQPDEAYAEGISPALRLILLAKRLLRRYAPRNDVFKTFLEPLVREISRAKNPLIPAHQLAEVYRDQLPSPEAIADRPCSSASSAGAAIADVQSGSTPIVSNNEHSILHTPCAELTRSPDRMFFAISDDNKRQP